MNHDALPFQRDMPHWPHVLRTVDRSAAYRDRCKAEGHYATPHFDSRYAIGVRLQIGLYQANQRRIARAAATREPEIA